jgi:hypothetical protein
MANTLIPIQTYTLTASALSVTFSNIPQNYTDLKLVLSTRTDYPAINDGMNIVLNGSTSNFTFRQLYGNGSTAASNSGSINVGPNTAGGSATASTFGNAEIYIPNYTSTTAKTINVYGVGETSATASYVGVNTTLWNPGTNVPITSVGFVSANGSYNIVSGSTLTLYGVSNGVKATGGTVAVAGGYAYHTFTTSGSFLPNQRIKNAEVLVVAGGGGGSQAGGGGGAGGLLFSPYQTFNAGSPYTAIIGAGSSGTSGGSNASRGTNSTLGPYTAIGGGGGSRASSGDVSANISGGSGGGAGGGTTTYNKFGLGTLGQGNNGGQGSNGSTYYSAGGGGGAGGVGGNVNVAIGGAGGNGVYSYSSWLSAVGLGVLGGIAGGGGGAGGQNATNAGGTAACGGGAGGDGSAGTATAGTAGTANTGGGGGGGGVGNSVDGNGASGGSGLIIVRYPLS